MKEVGAVAAGALLLLWPALWNGYPLLFSDTGAFLAQVPAPEMNWDKPWVYGPFLVLLHGGTTLWTASVGQAVIVSGVLRLTGRVLGLGAGAHVAVCAVLAAGSAAPWFASTLMPDVFAPLVVLCVFVLAYAPGRAVRAAAAVVGTLAISVHLAHLVLAAGCIAVACALRRRVVAPALLPLGAALVLVFTLNAAGMREIGISPYGNIFLLARMVGDGPARTTLAERCPAAGWRLCGWTGWLDGDSDRFLWDGTGPVWADGSGPTRLVDEAGVVVQATLLSHPAAVARAMAANTWAELWRVQVGDTLAPTHLDTTVWQALEAWFPPAEQERYARALQPRGLLRAWPWTAPHVPLLVAGLVGTGWLAVRGAGAGRGLAVLVLAGLVVNAFSTGALSALHDRYQARIVWLLLVPPLLYAAGVWASRRDTSPGGERTRAA